ncbi:citrate lyase subunit alpha [Marivita hallyeonensis]|uniref:Citrate lyase alpha chain n=1 Tax=Marivita hallyeonensis TaxID=996342 RepID=A0A1M5SBF8_9RHOB|nr:citrate lyase subunit alpha [Marivita hallyeonensis]SHH35819.1 citrate lyase subunit alpha / citrate CoA-transferase [Marivita hallyeonensis]
MPEGAIHTLGRRPDKCLTSLSDAVAATDLKDGATISFHHHLRNGDAVINTVVAMLAKAGLRDLHLAVTSLFPVHAPLIEHIQSGVIGRISASFISGPVGEAISRGILDDPVTLRSHGGRARAIDLGEMPIDLAFVAAPAADEMGNLSGRTGRAPCGTLGYPMVDVESARYVVAVTDTLAPFPVTPIDIAQDKVDFVVVIPSIGDPDGIASGATTPATDALSLGIAENTAAVIAASGLLEDGFSFQTGAGGISLATAAAVGREMRARNITGSFACGGITGFHVDMLESGLFRALMDVQCFDLAAVSSYSRNANHMAMSASAYAGPHVGGAVVDRLSAVVLGAAEVDVDFNVNVTTRAGGVLIGGSGGHADAAQGAQLTLITTRLTAAGFPKIVPKVTTLTTPGQSVDVVVTEAGLAVNPARAELYDRLVSAGLPVVSVHDLAAMAAQAADKQVPPRPKGPVVAVSEYRDGTVIDEIRRIDEA